MDQLADRLLSFPVRQSEYAPNTLTTGLYVGILGDFYAGYWIADSLAIQIQRLIELYAPTNQTGFIARAETDGMPVCDRLHSGPEVHWVWRGGPIAVSRATALLSAP